MTKIPKKTNVESMDRIIDEMEDDEVVLDEHEQNLEAIEDIRRQIKEKHVEF